LQTPLHDLARHGQIPWVDYLSRPFAREGELGWLTGGGVLGVTSNPTIFQGAQLIGADTVVTRPRETAEEFLDHRTVADRLTGQVDEARRTFERSGSSGVDYGSVVAALEREGSISSAPPSRNCSM
jgi:transaldolase